MNKEELETRVNAIVQRALTEMKCMVLRAQHLHDDINELKADPSTEMVEAFCHKHNHLQTS